MVNNAGTGGTESAGAVHDMSEETWDFVMYASSLLLSSPSSPTIYPSLFPRFHPPPKQKPTLVLPAATSTPPTNDPLPIHPTGISTPAASSSAASTRARSSCARSGAPTGTGAGSSIRRACLDWWGCSLVLVRCFLSCYSRLEPGRRWGVGGDECLLGVGSGWSGLVRWFGSGRGLMCRAL